MADSNITKRALANALKELMEEVPFSKISISEICERCNMSRKSFYYHFKDKYDLVNWIFDSEFIGVAIDEKYRASQNTWYKLRILCQYFYSNHSFYRKVLTIEGQNSFTEHFRELLFQTVSDQLKDVFPTERSLKFQLNFVTDALVMAVHRWLTEEEPMPPKEFIDQCKIGLHYASVRLKELEQEIKEAEEE